MVVQLFITFVEAINRKEKRLGIGDVNSYRHAEGATSLPHRIEAPVIHVDQFSGGHTIAEIQS